MCARTKSTWAGSASLFIAALSFCRAASCFPSRCLPKAAIRNASGPFTSRGWAIETRKSAGDTKRCSPRADASSMIALS